MEEQLGRREKLAKILTDKILKELKSSAQGSVMLGLLPPLFKYDFSLNHVFSRFNKFSKLWDEYCFSKISIDGDSFLGDYLEKSMMEYVDKAISCLNPSIKIDDSKTKTYMDRDGDELLLVVKLYSYEGKEYEKVFTFGGIVDPNVDTISIALPDYNEEFQKKRCDREFNSNFVDMLTKDILDEVSDNIAEKVENKNKVSVIVSSFNLLYIIKKLNATKKKEKERMINMLNEKKTRREDLAYAVAERIFFKILDVPRDIARYLDFSSKIFQVDYSNVFSRFRRFKVYENGGLSPHPLNIGNNLYLEEVIRNYIDRYTEGINPVSMTMDVNDNCKEATLKFYDVDIDHEEKQPIREYRFVGMNCNLIGEDNINRLDVTLPDYSTFIEEDRLENVFESNFKQIVIHDIAQSLMFNIEGLENKSSAKIYVQIKNHEYFYKKGKEWVDKFEKRSHFYPYKFNPNTDITWKSLSEPLQWNVYLYKYNEESKTHKFFDWYHIEGCLDHLLEVLNDKDYDCREINHSKDLVRYHKLNTDNYIAMYDNHSITDDIILVTKDKDSKYKELIEKGYKLYVVHRMKVDDVFSYTIISKMKEAVKSNNTITSNTKVSNIRYFTNNIEKAIRGQMDNHLQAKFNRFDGSKNPFKHYSRYGFERRQVDEKTYALTLYGDTSNCDSHVIYHYE